MVLLCEEGYRLSTLSDFTSHHLRTSYLRWHRFAVHYYCKLFCMRWQTTFHTFAWICKTISTFIDIYTSKMFCIERANLRQWTSNKARQHAGLTDVTISRCFGDELFGYSCLMGSTFFFSCAFKHLFAFNMYIIIIKWTHRPFHISI